MLRVLNAHSLAINLFLLFIAFSPTPFLYCGPTDLLAAVIILISTYIIVNDFKNQKFSYYNIILLSLLSALNCFFRYASIPNLLIIPFFYFLIALISKQRKYFFASVLQLAISSVLLIVFFFSL
jgi:Na+/melibiose symporter-like transporter